MKQGQPLSIVVHTATAFVALVLIGTIILQGRPNTPKLVPGSITSAPTSLETRPITSLGAIDPIPSPPPPPRP